VTNPGFVRRSKIKREQPDNLARWQSSDCKGYSPQSHQFSQFTHRINNSKTTIGML
jgi:hypothetical protein